MPTDEKVLGFSNRWYKEGFANLIQYEIDEHATVNIFSSTYFIASKFEAFKGRGQNDGRTSQDFEDIVFLLDNRASIWEEINAANKNLKEYLKVECSTLLDNPYFEEWLSVHLEFETAAVRVRRIISSVNEFLKNEF